MFLSDMESTVSNTSQLSPSLPVGGRNVGRPPAKHSSPDYSQMTVYVHKSIRNSVKVRLFQDGLELSGLVERLLAAWFTSPRSE